MIRYKDVMDRGFVRCDMSDSVHQKIHGYDDFWVELKLVRCVRISWCNKELACKLTVCDREANILDREPIDTVEKLDTAIAFWKNFKSARKSYKS